MKPPYHLVADSLSDDTVECLATLLDDAKRGRVLGIAFAAILSRREFITNTAGECSRNPVFARGLVAALDDELRDMVHR